jgi:hypothetical protein
MISHNSLGKFGGVVFDGVDGVDGSIGVMGVLLNWLIRNCLYMDSGCINNDIMVVGL